MGGNVDAHARAQMMRAMDMLVGMATEVATLFRVARMEIPGLPESFSGGGTSAWQPLFVFADSEERVLAIEKALSAALPDGEKDAVLASTRLLVDELKRENASLRRRLSVLEHDGEVGLPALLHWRSFTDIATSWREAHLRDFAGGDGVRFSIEHVPSCHRRGPWKLLVEVCSGENHARWGCFDEQDQPQRWYHDEERAMLEAEAIARVLDRERGQ